MLNVTDSYLEYYTQPGTMTDPGQYTHLFDDLPNDVVSLCKVVQGLMLHVFWAERYGVRLNARRSDEVQIRSVKRKLARILELDDQPLIKARSVEKKLVGNCRDFSVMLTAMLRHKGIPARARCGFGRYFHVGTYEDHWVAEYWDKTESRWKLVDSQLDDLQQMALHIRFNPLDVPRTAFITGGKAWQMCRSGEADPQKFGIFKMRGLWFIRGDFVRDVAALNKVELLPWDGWGLISKPYKTFTRQDFTFLDDTAILTEGDVPKFDEVRALYEGDERLLVTPVITAYLDMGERQVTLAEE